jgi:hypothetical protein
LLCHIGVQADFLRRKTMTVLGTRARVCAGVLWLALAATRVDAATVTVRWDANPEPDITGYEVCARLVTQGCGAGVAVGNRTTWTFTGLSNTAQYVFAVRARNSAGSASGWAEINYVTPAPIPAGSEASRSDFNSDGWLDLLWQHQSGQLVTWHLTGTSVLQARLLEPSAVAAGWKLSGSGDLNRDGKPDLVWHNEQSGQVVYWLMDGVLNYSSGFLPGPVATDWRIATVRDMNLDGNPDIWWHNQNTGDMLVWYMNGTTVTSTGTPNPSRIADKNWKLRGTGDFNGDGRPDAVWHNHVTGEMRIWLLNGLTAVSVVAPNPSVVGSGWKIAAVGDATLDGWPDLIWQNDNTGGLVLWALVGTNLTASGWLSIPSADVTWKIVAPR